jgi:ABC-type sulfate transport system permease subunit
MTVARIFRALLITQILLPIIARLTGAIQDSAHPLASHFAHPNVFRAVGLVVVVADIAVTIGLWRFRAWARIGAVILLLIALAFAFSQFHAAFVSRGSFALMYTEQFITGVLCAMMFLPPLSLEFAQRKV